MKNFLGIVAFIVALFVAGPPAKRAVEGVLNRGQVPQALLEAPWERQSVGNLSFDSPWQLGGKSLDFPAEVAARVDSSETQMREKDGLMVMAMRVTYLGQVEVRLSGAIEGAEKSLRAQAGTKSVQFAYDNTSIGGYPGAVLDAVITRDKGEQLRCRGLVIARKESLYQLLLLFRADQPNGEVAWRRLRGSAKIDGRT